MKAYEKSDVHIQASLAVLAAEGALQARWLSYTAAPECRQARKKEGQRGYQIFNSPHSHPCMTAHTTNFQYPCSLSSILWWKRSQIFP